MIKRKIFITGVTGGLGRELLRLFLFSPDVELILLIRGKTTQICKDRYLRLKHDLVQNEKILAKVSIVAGDITNETLGIDRKIYDQLCSSVTEIYHCAALVGYNESLKRVRLVNVTGTKNVLTLAKKCPSLIKLNYISTAFIIGKSQGILEEKDLDIGQDFNSPYERSKFEAENLLKRNFNKKFSIAIFRPSIIVGAYRDAKINSFQMFYQYSRTLSLNLIKILPLNFKSVINLVPCDLAAEAIFLLSQNFDKNETYHVFSNQNQSILKITNFASKYVGFRKPKYVDLAGFDVEHLSLFEKKLLKVYLPFLNFGAIFKADKTINQLKKLGFNYPRIDNKFISRLFDYAINRKFIMKGNLGYSSTK